MKKSKRAAQSPSATSTIDLPTLEGKISEAVISTGIAEVVRSESSHKQITLKCRVHNEKVWLPIVNFLLQEEDRSRQWEAHICQHYFLYKGKLVYTWSMTFGSDDLAFAVDDISRIISTMSQSIRHFSAQKPVESSTRAPVVKGNGDSASMKRVRDDDVPGAGIDSSMKGREVVEMPLVGVTAKRNQPEGPVGMTGRRSKGAHLIGNKRNQYQ